MRKKNLRPNYRAEKFEKMVIFPVKILHWRFEQVRIALKKFHQVQIVAH